MDWKKVQESAGDYFSASDLVRSFSSDEILKIAPDSNKLFLGPIDWSWGATDDEVGAQLLDDALKNLYVNHCNQVENLLGEAAMLIDRSLSDLMKYDELNVERFKIVVEFAEFQKTLAQQQTEQADVDFWQGPAVEGDFASQARIAAIGDQNQIEKNYDAIDLAYKQGADFFWNKGNDGDGSRYPIVGSRSSSQGARLQYEAQAAANQFDSQSRLARKKFEERSRIHQLERQQISQDIIAIKLNEVQKPRGALNYNERMREIGKRALRDFKEVSVRLSAIALGLEEFYAITDVSEADLDNDLEQARTRIEGAVTWLRKAGNALARAKIDEMETVVRITINRPSSTLLKELHEGVTISFLDNFVPDTKRVQLRGVSATINSQDAWLDLELTSPPHRLLTVDKLLPAVTIKLGRVSSAAAMNVRDVVGMRPIVNRTPIGNWTVRAVRDYRGKSVSRIDLDFQLATVRV